ncbi:MAG: BrnA antitoxin family protein [Clostridia bacterium]|nr:BrnA antitoxin family protein [Clostridia bacterium]
MLEEYDFSHAKRNPYVKKLKQQVTINLRKTTIKYFKDMAEETGIGYQTLIDIFLDQCVREGKTLEFK